MPRGTARQATIHLEGAQQGHADDEARLRQLGYKQELRRELNLLRNFAVSFGLLSMLTGLGGFYYIGFQYGGPVTVVWGWVLIVGMTLSVALPMAEICSSLPTTGGVYYWAGVLGGKQGPLMSWICGWLNLIGQVGITAGVEWTVVRYLMYLINMFRPADDPFAFTKAQFWAVYSGFILLHGTFNAISVKLLGFLSIVSVVFHVAGTLAIVIGLPIIARVRQPASWVFGHFENYGNEAQWMGEGLTTGVTNSGFSFLLGLLMSQWAMVGYDSSAHIAEETKNAAVAGPLGLIMAILGSFICGWMFLLSLTFSMQSPADGVAGVQQIFMSVFSSRWGSFEGAASFQLIVFLASNLCGIFCVTSNRCAPPGGTLQLRERALAGATAANSNCARLLPRSLSPQAARVVSLPWQRPWPPRPAGPRPAAPPRRSRMLYAFARDHGVLGSRWWKQVSNATGTPVNSIIGMCMAAVLIGLTMLGSDVAFIAISSIGIIGLECSYILPIFLRLTVARRWFKKGPFHLGRFSLIVGWVGVTWGCFISVILVLPTYYPVTNKNLNYASVMLVGTIALAMIAWVVSARKWFKGPVRNVDTGNKTETLAEAAMRGELDEGESAWGGEAGDGAPAKNDASSAEGEPKEQFVVA
ncbi:hypothetical protein ABPG77_009544 [Micractinium sp. CCAP 211/92]